MGIVFDMLSGNLFPLRVASTIKHPPFCPTQFNNKKPKIKTNRQTKKTREKRKLSKHLNMIVVCCTCKLSDVEVEARGVEGPVIVVAVSGFEVASRVELGRVPEATSKISEEREVGPKLQDFADEDGVVVD